MRRRRARVDIAASLTEQGGTSRTEVRVGGRLACDGLDSPGALTFVPASADRRCSYRDADLFYSALWIDPAIQDSLPGSEALSAAAPIVNGNDAVIGSLLASLREDVVVGLQPDTAYIEHCIATHPSDSRPRTGRISTTGRRRRPNGIVVARCPREAWSRWWRPAANEALRSAILRSGCPLLTGRFRREVEGWHRPPSVPRTTDLDRTPKPPSKDLDPILSRV
jgi:hypothetical protein